MKISIVYVSVLACIIIFIPFLLANSVTDDDAFPNANIVQTVYNPISHASVWKTHTIKVLDGDDIKNISVFDYLCGVVAAEMLSSAPAEALKAQSVAAFSFAMYRKETLDKNPNAKLEDKSACVCTNYQHCLAYMPKYAAEEKWGNEWFNKYWPKIESAVSEVLGKVIVYNSVPINAVFHDTSSGKTESAENIWGQAVPYLLSVDSPADVESAPYNSSCEFTAEEIESILISAGNSSLTLAKDPQSWFRIDLRSDSGAVMKISVGNSSFSGQEIRQFFGLRSENFDVEYNGENFIFTVRGYGHGVGMSQTGAIAMSKEGKNYAEILKWYYTGVDIVDYIWSQE